MTSLNYMYITKNTRKKLICFKRSYHKNSDTENIVLIILKFEQRGFTIEKSFQKMEDKIAHSVDPLGAVWSGSALFAQTYLSENLHVHVGTMR